MDARVRDARVARLATVHPDGRPHVVVCCFAVDGDVVYTPIDDKPKTTASLQRLRNLEANPAASLLVDHYDEDWAKLWWVRIDGTARLLHDGAEHGAGVASLTAKYEQYRHRPPSGVVIAVDIHRWVRWP